ncbi:MAG: Dabb family protein [Duncaniella sp.]|nr:Dabb family protein [Duncaniella sp.]
MVKHVVTFQLEGSAEERVEVSRKFKEALERLPECIDVLSSIEVGINENPAESWDIVLIADLPDMDAVRVYAEHPAHVAAAAIIKDHKKSRACVDFYC